MVAFDVLYGPIPSRRLGRSLGISPTQHKVCNFNCIYCQLGETKALQVTPQAFVPLEAILQAFEAFLETEEPFDVVSIVGNGEPTLYRDIKPLIIALKERTKKPVAVVTNGATFERRDVFEALLMADIVLPTLNGHDEASFKRIHRPHPSLRFDDVYKHLVRFSKAYQGALWLEVMVMKDVNDDAQTIDKIKQCLEPITVDKLYLNTPVRAPAVKAVEAVDKNAMLRIAKALNGIPIDYLSHPDYRSHIKDDYEAIKSIIKHHPMHQFEIEAFLKARKCSSQPLIKRLEADHTVDVQSYKGYTLYRIKP